MIFEMLFGQIDSIAIFTRSRLVSLITGSPVFDRIPAGRMSHIWQLSLSIWRFCRSISVMIMPCRSFCRLSCGVNAFSLWWKNVWLASQNCRTQSFFLLDFSSSCIPSNDDRLNARSTALCSFKHSPWRAAHARSRGSKSSRQLLITSREISLQTRSASL